MTAYECQYEETLVEAIEAQRWPNRAPELVAHVETCAVCAELATVMTAFAAEGEVARHAARGVPPAEVVWWRAQLRARQDARETAARPLTWAQAIAGACSLGVLVALGRLTLEHTTAFATWFMARLTSMATVTLLMPESNVVALMLYAASLAVGVMLALVPLAILITSDD